MSKITDAQIELLKGSTSGDDWTDRVAIIKTEHGGQFPEDWWPRVKQTGLMDEILGRFGETSEIKIFVPKASTPKLPTRLSDVVGMLYLAHSMIDMIPSTVFPNLLLFYADLRALLKKGSAITRAEWECTAEGPKPLGILNNRELDASDFAILSDTFNKDFYRDPKAFWAYWHENSVSKKIGETINMVAAMQQLAEPDPWLDAPLTAEEKECFANSDVEGGMPWD